MTITSACQPTRPTWAILGIFLLFSLVLTGLPAFAQVDLSGQWGPAGDTPAVPADLAEQSREWDRLGAYPTTASTMGEPLRLDVAGSRSVR